MRLFSFRGADHGRDGCGDVARTHIHFSGFAYSAVGFLLPHLLLLYCDACGNTPTATHLLTCSLRTLGSVLVLVLYSLFSGDILPYVVLRFVVVGDVSCPTVCGAGDA